MEAPGGPGSPPTWGPGRKQAFGSSPGISSKVWFTLARGNLSEVFFPTLDRPALHELRFLVAAPGITPVDDAAQADHSLRWAKAGVPAIEVFSSHAEYHLSKEFLVDTELNALLIACDFNPELPDLRLYLMATPHLNRFGLGNDAIITAGSPPALIARQGDVHIALCGPFDRASAGYRDSSDVFVDLHDNEGEMTATYPSAGPGNVAVGAQLALHAGVFQVAVGFAHSRPDAEEVAREMLRRGAAGTRAALEEAWRKQSDLPARVAQVAGDGGALAAASMTVLKCLEDKEERGGFVTAPGAPWGESNKDGNHVYNLVWSRDLYHATTALLDLGDGEAAARALHHLARVQRPDGSWPQNWTPSGKPHWNGTELDEVAYPILLARRLQAAQGIDWDPYPQLVRRAALYLIRNGPLTPLDRWEDAGGLSPSTLAVVVAALVSASEFAHAAGEHLAAAHFLHVADYWADRVEAWCYSSERGHYVRLGSDPETGPTPDAVLSVDFLELVRLGLRPADNAEIRSSIAQVDRQLLWIGPGGPAWRRYVGDTYGEPTDGSAWGPGGVGRPWPLLAGERAQYEFLAGGDRVSGLARTYETFAGPGLMLPEQVWDGKAISQRGLLPGMATNSAAPLGWAHAEYLKLLSTIANQRCGDLLPHVQQRYCVEP
ncbi:MAG: glycoside hydrolase family 15 protein, partial [Candidatus Dormibacteraeota bacterium]|nr:glycoside hydrolase family 15 protein [Candidatus Dormibacteraeota bacterium]